MRFKGSILFEIAGGVWKMSRETYIGYMTSCILHCPAHLAFRCRYGHSTIQKSFFQIVYGHNVVMLRYALHTSPPKLAHSGYPFSSYIFVFRNYLALNLRVLYAGKEKKDERRWWKELLFSSFLSLAGEPVGRLKIPTIFFEKFWGF